MILLIVNMCAAAVVFVSGLFFAIKNMSRCTKFGIRLAWLCMTTGALGVLIAPIFSIRSPTISESVLLVGFAMFIICGRWNKGVWCRWIT